MTAAELPAAAGHLWESGTSPPRVARQDRDRCAPPTPLVVATDATVRPGARAAAWVDSNGRWWVTADALAEDPGQAMMGNRVMRAECFAIVRAVATHPPCEVWSDNLAAVHLCTAWAGGDTPRLREWGEHRQVRQLRRLVTDRPGFTYRHVRGHSGVHLNMAADRLAAIAADGVSTGRLVVAVRTACDAVVRQAVGQHRAEVRRAITIQQDP